MQQPRIVQGPVVAAGLIAEKVPSQLVQASSLGRYPIIYIAADAFAGSRKNDMGQF